MVKIGLVNDIQGGRFQSKPKKEVEEEDEEVINFNKACASELKEVKNTSELNELS